MGEGRGECCHPLCIDRAITSNGYPRCAVHLDYEPEKEDHVTKHKVQKPKEEPVLERCGVPDCQSKPASRGLCWKHAKDGTMRDKYALPSKHKFTGNRHTGKKKKAALKTRPTKTVSKKKPSVCTTDTEGVSDIVAMIEKRAGERADEIIKERCGELITALESTLAAAQVQLGL